MGCPADELCQAKMQRGNDGGSARVMVMLIQPLMVMVVLELVVMVGLHMTLEEMESWMALSMMMTTGWMEQQLLIAHHRARRLRGDGCPAMSYCVNGE